MSFNDTTICSWVNITNNSAHPVVISFGDSSDGNNLICITALGGGTFRYNMIANASQTTIDAGSYSTGTWYFVAAVSRASNDHELFLDGVSVGTSTVTKSFTGSTDRWMIGRFAGSSDWSQIMNGRIAFPCIYDRALTDNEIKEIMYKPYSVVNGLVWAPDMFIAGSVAGDFLDLSGGGFNPNQNSGIPASDPLGPPVFI